MSVECNILVGKPKEKGPHERPSCRQQNNSKMNIRDIGFEGVDLILLVRVMDYWGYCNHRNGHLGSRRGQGSLD
jgi:hypothetical protein